MYHYSCHLIVVSFSEKMNLKNKILLHFVQTCKKGKWLNIWKCHVTMTRNDAYISNKMQLQTHSLTFFHKNKSFLSATSILSRSPMVYNTTASLEKLTCSDYMDFGKCQDRFGQFSWSKNDSKYLDVKFKVFKKDAKREFRLIHLHWERQILTSLSG